MKINNMVFQLIPLEVKNTYFIRKKDNRYIVDDVMSYEIGDSIHGSEIISVECTTINNIPHEYQRHFVGYDSKSLMFVYFLKECIGI
jgi:hypothetical protein